VDAQGHIFVVDYESLYITEFDEQGWVVNRFAGRGQEEGKLQNPYPARWSHWGSLLVWDHWEPAKAP